MKFDREAYDRMSDDEKADYLRRYREEAREQSKGKTFPPGSIAPEKARFQEGFEVIGQEDEDGTVHYYADDEKPPSRYDEPADTSDDEDETT